MSEDVFKLKRGTTAQVASYLPSVGEPVYNITLKKFSIGDGVTLGGVDPAASKAESGANTDITSLGGLTTVLTIAQGGTGNATGLAATATALATTRSISTTGDATWTVNFNGTANATATITLANSGVGAGSYDKVTVNAKGLVTGGVATTAYTNVTLLNSWTVTASRRAAYRKVGDDLHLEIQITGGTAADNTVLFNLPVGFRPAFPVAINVCSGTNASISSTVTVPRVLINTTGDVTCVNCSSTTGIFFSARVALI
jgi:hypothetical protein